MNELSITNTKSPYMDELQKWVDDRFAHRNAIAKKFILGKIIDRHKSSGIPSKGPMHDFIKEARLDISKQVGLMLKEQGH